MRYWCVIGNRELSVTYRKGRNKQMSSCEHTQSANGLSRIGMRNDRLRLSILPEAGGKITELVDLQSNRNWLWSNPGIPFARAEYDVDFGRILDSGGWDEILMSVSPTELKLNDDTTFYIPDHGDVVGQHWVVSRADVDPNGDAVCEMTVQGRAADYQLTRAVRLPEGSARLELSYTLTNNETHDVPWYWCAHALLAAESDLFIDLPAGQVFRVDQCSARSNHADTVKKNWPILDLTCGKMLDLSRSFASIVEDDRFAAKVFARTPESGIVNVGFANTNERFSLQYDPERMPWLGLWINNKGWSESTGELVQVLGLEPATAPYDDVAEALENDAISWLQAGETRRWSMAVEIRS